MLFSLLKEKLYQHRPQIAKNNFCVTKLVVTPPHHSTLQRHPAMAPRPLLRTWSSPSPPTKAHCNGTLQWHHIHSANGTTSTPKNPYSYRYLGKKNESDLESHRSRRYFFFGRGTSKTVAFCQELISTFAMRHLCYTQGVPWEKVGRWPGNLVRFFRAHHLSALLYTQFATSWCVGQKQVMNMASWLEKW